MIRGFAGVVSNGSGGVDFYCALQLGSVNRVLQQALPCGGTTNITEANKQYGTGVTH